MLIVFARRRKSFIVSTNYDNMLITVNNLRRKLYAFQRFFFYYERVGRIDGLTAFVAFSDDVNIKFIH